MEQYEKLTDEQLIEKLHSGDRDVTDYLMEKYKMMVRKKARAMYLIGGASEDDQNARRDNQAVKS